MWKVLALVVLVACSKTNAQRDKERIQERAAQELKDLKTKLGDLEKKASSLTQRLDDVDDQLTKLFDDLTKATDEKARSLIQDKLDKLQLEREDVEAELKTLLDQVAK